jgi:hypothetical protein
MQAGARVLGLLASEQVVDAAQAIQVLVRLHGRQFSQLSLVRDLVAGAAASVGKGTSLLMAKVVGVIAWRGL